MCDLEYITQPILGPAETGTVCPISAPHVKPGAGQGVVEGTAWDGALHGLPGDQVGHLHLIRLTITMEILWPPISLSNVSLFTGRV